MTETAAHQVDPGSRIRINHGPKAGHEGVVRSATHATQMGSLIHMVIFDFTDGSRSVRPATELVTVR